MIGQIKKFGDSLVIVISPKFAQYHGLKEEDWVNYADVFKIKKPKKEVNKDGRRKTN